MFLNEVSWWHLICKPFLLWAGARELKGLKSTECFVPRVAEQGHTCLWHLWLGQPVPPALCSFQTHPPCLWTSSHFQATVSVCYLQGIVSKTPPNLKWGGCFPSAIPTLGTAAPEAQSEHAISKLVTEQKPEMHMRSNSKHMKKLKERSYRAGLCLNSFLRGVWFRGYFLFIFM